MLKALQALQLADNHNWLTFAIKALQASTKNAKEAPPPQFHQRIVEKTCLYSTTIDKNK